MTTTLTEQPLVIQELTAFFTGPLRDTLRASGLPYSFGDADTGADFDEIVFDPTTMTVLVEITANGQTEAGNVIAYGRGGLAVFNAMYAFTEQYGQPATFHATLSDQPEPRVIRDVVAKMVR